MKTWRRILLITSIVYVVILILVSINLMFNNSCTKPLIQLGQSGPENFHCGLNFFEILPIFVIFGMPSWIILIIVLFYKNNKKR